MKRLLFIHLSLLVLSISSLQAQQLILPQASPKASVSQTIGLSDIAVYYHTPSVKGREIWGKLVPYGQVWRTGANEATVITFNDDVIVQGEKLPAGTYSLFTIPEANDNWTIIFNKNPKQWGAFDYKPEDDILRVPVQAITQEFHETLFFSFTNIQRSSGDLNINWEKIRIPIHIETDVDKKALNNIRVAVTQAAQDDWKTYAQAVSYLVQNNKEPEYALDLVNRSISINENFYNNWLKAQLLAQHNEYKEAVNLVKKAMKLGKKDKENYKTYATDIEIAYETWRVKI